MTDASTEAALFMLHREHANVTTIATFTVDGEPVSKARARFTNQGSKTRTYTPEKTKQAERVVALKFRSSAPGHQPNADSTYGVFGIFFAGTRQRRDVDNMLKLICDGLNGVAWADDSQVVEISGRRGFDLPENARTEVWVYEVGHVPEGPMSTCENCGQLYHTFDSWRNKRRFCSPTCRQASAARARTRTCTRCGKNFDGRASAKFCSTACKHLGTTASVACVQCGSVETMPQSIAAQRAPVCRSQACQAAYWRERRKTSSKGTCSTCGGPTSKKAYTNCQPCNTRLRKELT